MAGAVNAANNIQYRTWKSRGTTADGIPDFLIEGDFCDVFDEHRLTLAWEVHDTRLTKPPGNLTLFQKGAKEGQPLTNFTTAYQKGPAGPVAVVYNSKDAALWYDCQDTRAIRRSISLDLDVNTITNEDLEILSPTSLTAGEAAGLTLWDLITRFPTPN